MFNNIDNVLKTQVTLRSPGLHVLVLHVVHVCLTYDLFSIASWLFLNYFWWRRTRRGHHIHVIERSKFWGYYKTSSRSAFCTIPSKPASPKNSASFLIFFKPDRAVGRSILSRLPVCSRVYTRCAECECDRLLTGSECDDWWMDWRTLR